MKYSRSALVISFVVYPALITLMTIPDGLESSAQFLITPPVAMMMSGVSLLPFFLLIERIPKPKNIVRGVAQAFGILAVGALLSEGIVASFSVCYMGISSLSDPSVWEQALYSKHVSSYILCSLFYLARIGNEYES